MEEVACPANLNQAYKRVKANQGAAGVDGMPVSALRAWIAEHRDWPVTALLDGTYQPAAVRGVTLPKPGGGTRQLGIPTVVDRLVQQAIVQVLERRLRLRLRLRVNQEKSAVAPVHHRQFLGYRLHRDGSLGISPAAYRRAKARLRAITSRRRGVPLSQVIAAVNAFTTGWVRYFQHAHAQTALQALDQWLRRRLRCLRLKQAKTPSGLHRLLTRNGVPPSNARKLAGSGRGWWPLANTPQAARALSLTWFDQRGLKTLVAHYKAVTTTDNRRGTRRVRPVV